MEKYLKNKFGEGCGTQLMARVQAAVPAMKRELPEYDSFLTRKVAHSILPVIALYKALHQDGREDEPARVCGRLALTQSCSEGWQ